MARFARRLGELLPRVGFVRNVSLLTGGIVLGQALSVLISPLLTRLYTPADFGIFAAYNALVGILGVFMSLRYDQAVPLPKTRRAAVHVLVLALLILAVTTPLSALLTVFWGAALASRLNAPGLVPYLWWVPVGLAALTLYQILNFWAIRQKAFGRLAATKLHQSLASSAVQVGFGFAGGPLGLLVGKVVSFAAGTTTLARVAWPALRRTRISARRLVTVAAVYRKFPLYSTWATLFFNLGGQLPALLLLYLFDPVVAGLYAVAERILRLPMILLGESTRQVFYAEAAEAVRTGGLRDKARQVFTTLLQIGLPVGMLIVLTAPDAFGLVFGPAWRNAGSYAQWLAPWLIAVFLAAPLSAIPTVLGKQRHELLFHALLLGGPVLAYVAATHWRRDPLVVIAVLSLFQAVCWLGFAIWNLSLSGYRWTETLGLTTRALPRVLLFALPILVAKVAVSEPLKPWAVLLTGAICGAWLVLPALSVLRRGA